MKREEPDLIQRKADPVNLGATLITTMHSCHSLGSLLGIKESHHTFRDQSPSLHSSRLSTPMSQSGEGIRAVMSRKEWFTANIIELGEDPETVLSMRVSMQVTS